MTGRILHFPQRPYSPEEGSAAARRILRFAFTERLSRAADLALEQAETLLSLCLRLREMLDSSPSTARDEAEFFYRFLEKPKRPIGLFDEREYFLGELAMTAGTACRHLSRREEARLWFDRADAGFRHTVNSEADLSRLGYQRLALRLEERQIDSVLELVPSLVESFQRLKMPDDALKCRFLEGSALMEGSRAAEASEVYERICHDAGRLGNNRLLALGYTNLTHVYAVLGEPKKAIVASQRAIPLLEGLNDRIGLAKVQWGLANLLREEHQLGMAIDAYRAAQERFQALGMLADVAALRLVVADLFLEAAQEGEAIREILAALPIIDELKMVPESVAALSLLRESVRQQRINRQALRELHGYFDNLQS